MSTRHIPSSSTSSTSASLRYHRLAHRTSVLVSITVHRTTLSSSVLFLPSRQLSSAIFINQQRVNSVSKLYIAFLAMPSSASGTLTVDTKQRSQSPLDSPASSPSASPLSGNTIASLSSSSPNLALMIEGRPFTLYSLNSTYTLSTTAPPASALTITTVVISYTPSSHKLGSLTITPSDGSPSALPVHHISDIYLDQQHAPEWSRLAQHEQSDSTSSCFTLVSRRRNTQLCLRAESPLTRNAYLAGIQQLFDSAKRTVTSTKKRRSALDVLHSALNASPVIRLMQQGQHVQHLLPPLPLQPVTSFLHYIPSHSKVGSLVWTDDAHAVEQLERLQDVESELPLSEVTDVWAGKAGGADGAEWEEGRVMSVARRGGTVLHVVCESEEKRRVWLDGMQEVFAIVARMGKNKVSEAERTERDDRQEDGREEEKTTEPAVVAVEGSEREVVVHVDDSPGLADVLPAPDVVDIIALPLPSMDALAVDDDTTVVGGYTYEVDEAVLAEEKQANDQQHQRHQQPQYATDIDYPPLSSAQAAADALTAGNSYRYLTEEESGSSYQYTAEDINNSSNQPASPITPTASADPASSFSPVSHPAVLALLNGFSFTSYTTTTSTTVYLSYNQHEGRLGTLYYTDAPPTTGNSTVPSPLPVSSLCDVFVGKQSAELRSAIAAEAQAGCCFTIASASVALHLSASSESDKNTFLEAIKQLFLSQGKQVKQQRKTKRQSAVGAGRVAATQIVGQSTLDRINDQQQLRQTMQATSTSGTQREDRAMTMGASAAPVVPVQSRVAADAKAAPAKQPHPSNLAHASTVPITSAPVEPLLPSTPTLTHSPPTTPLHYLLSTSPLLSVLRNGAHFTALFGAPPIPTMAVPLFLFYSPTSSRLGSLHWCDAAHPFTYVPQQSLPLHRLSEVVQGKGTDEMRSVVGGGYKESVCFSLVSGKRGMGLHLVGKTDKDKREWVDAVRSVFVLSRGGRDGNGASAAEEEKAASTAPVARAADVSLLPSVPLDVCIQLLSSGYGVSFVWQAGASAAIEREERLLWWDETEDGDVQLCWNERLERKRVEGQYMSVHDIDATWLGKQHNAILAAPELAAVPAEQCVSLVCTRSQQAIHLVAERADSQASFVTALRQVLLHFQTKVKVEGPVAASAITLLLTPLQPLTAAELLTGGSTFLSFQRDSPSPSLLTLAPSYSASPVVVQWERHDGGSKYGQFTVTSLSSSATATAAAPRPYGPFHEILAGKRSAEFSADVAAAMPADCCLSLVGKEGALHLSAGSEVQRNLWIEAIKAVYAAANKPISDSSAAVLQTNDTTLATKIPLLVQGVLAIQHLQTPAVAGVKAAVIPPQRIWLAYEPTVSAKGRLSWIREDEKNKAGRSYDGHIDIHDITGLQAGSGDFQHTQQFRVDSERCVSMWTDTGKRLDLEFTSTLERRAFVSAVHSLLLSTRDLTALSADTLCVKQGQAKLIINSPFGVCELTHTPQPQQSLPPLIRLSLPWGVLSAPPELPLVKFVAVYSGQGLGFVVLPLDGWGGRKRVEVWMRGSGGSTGVTVVKVLLSVSDVLVIPVMPASMADMVRQLFSGVRHPTPVTGMGGHRGQGSVMAAANLSDSALLEELNVRYNREVQRLSVDPNTAGLVNAAAAPANGQRSSVTVPSGEIDSAAPALPLLRFGHLITIWSGTRTAATAAYILLYLDEPTNTLYWHGVSAPKLITPASSLSITDITRAVKGKQTEPLQSNTAAVVPDECCFALQLTSGRSVSLQASSQQAREEWLLELAQWIDYRARKDGGVHKRQSATAFVPPTVPLAHLCQPSVAASALFTVGAPAAVAPLPTVAAPPTATNAPPQPFGSGDTFMSYSSKADPKSIFLFYEPTSSRLGSFYWCEAAVASQRPMDAERRLPLVSLCDLTIGKGGEGWEGPGDRADAYKCWSLRTRRVGLCLEASSVEVRDRWINGIKEIIAADGKRVIE